MTSKATIKYKQLNKIKCFKFKIFDFEDDDYVNVGAINLLNYHIDRILNEITKDTEQQVEIYNAIRWKNDNCKEKLEELGYEVVENDR